MSGEWMSLASEAGYEFRPFEPTDREQYLSLFDRVLGGGPTEDWFAWKFEDNPYVDHTPVYVVERDGDLLGSVAAWPLRMRTGDTTVTAIQICDAFVHPDHQHQGLYTGLMEFLLDRYRPHDAAFCFDFPNEELSGANERFGWRTLSQSDTYYRIQNPGPFIGANEWFEAAGTAIARAYLSLCRQIAPSSESLTVDRYEDVPAVAFARLYRTFVPTAIHLHRDETFYRWRYSNPNAEYSAFVVREEGDPVAGAIVETPVENDSPAIARIIDVAPLVPSVEAGDSLLGAIVGAYADVDAITAHPVTFTHRLLSRYGFNRDDTFPLSRFGTSTTFGVYSLHSEPDAAWRVNGYDLTDPDDWILSFSAQDTA